MSRPLASRDPSMPPDVRAALIEILAQALVADVERYPDLYAAAGPPAADEGETPR